MTLLEVLRARPAEFEAHHNDPWGYLVPRGESKLELLARIEAWLNSLPTDQAHVVVTHSGCFWLIRGLYVGATRADMDGYREPQTTSYLLEDGRSCERAMLGRLMTKFKMNPKALTVQI